MATVGKDVNNAMSIFCINSCSATLTHSLKAGTTISAFSTICYNFKVTEVIKEKSKVDKRNVIVQLYLIRSGWNQKGQNTDRELTLGVRQKKFAFFHIILIFFKKS